MTSSYHRTSFNRETRDLAIGNVVNTLKEIPRHVSLVFCGVSGMSIGFAVADETGRDFAVVRKAGDKSHAEEKIEGIINGEYIIIDDIMDTGATIDYILDQAERYGGECVGIILFRGALARRYKEIPIFE